MKIGLLSYRSHPYSGGQGIYLKHLSLALLNLGHEVDVLSGPPYPDLHKDINLIKISSLNLSILEIRPTLCFVNDLELYITHKEIRLNETKIRL